MSKKRQKPRYQLITLGRSEIRSIDPNEPAPLVGPSKPVALLACLAVAPRHSRDRDQVSLLLWDDEHADIGRHALRQTVWALRKRLGNDVVIATTDTLSLGPAVDSDYRIVWEALQGGDLETAVTAYEGDFLAGIGIAATDAFEEWVGGQRYKLRTAVQRAGETLLKTWLEEERYDEVIDLARRVRQIEPQCERVWRFLLQALIRLGDVSGATHEASQLQHLFQESGRFPEPETARLLRMVAQSGGPINLSNLEPPEIVGRSNEFSMILKASDRAAEGEPQHIHVTATAGGGKTALLANIAVRLDRSRFRVISLAAPPAERPASLSLASDLLRRIVGLPGSKGISPASGSELMLVNPAVSSFFPVRPDGAPTGEPRCRTAAFNELLEAIAEEEPIALLIDDLHWSDADSRTLLRDVLSRLQSARIMTVTATRPVTTGLIDTPRTTHLSLEPLTVGEIRELIELNGSLPPRQWARRLVAAVHRASDGVPAVAVDVISSLIREGIICHDELSLRCRDYRRINMMLTPRRILNDTLDQLNGTQCLILRILALARSPVPVDVLLATPSLNERDVFTDLLYLERRRLISRVGDVWRISSTTVKNAALDRSTGEELQYAHENLGIGMLSVREKHLWLLREASEHLVEAGRNDLMDYALETFGRGRSRPKRTPVLRPDDVTGETEPKLAGPGTVHRSRGA